MNDFEKLKENWKEQYRDNPIALDHMENFERLCKSGEEGYKNSDRVCGYCGLKQSEAPNVSFHIDHIVPRALGGTENEENLVDACEPCNYRKRDQRGWKTLDGRVGKAHTMDYVNGKWRMKNILK